MFNLVKSMRGLTSSTGLRHEDVMSLSSYYAPELSLPPRQDVRISETSQAHNEWLLGVEAPRESAIKRHRHEVR